jgi:hypothetical protein
MVRRYALLSLFFSIQLYMIVLVLLTYFVWHPSYPRSPIQIESAYAVSKGDYLCNCTLDLVDNVAGFELPNVKIIKSEFMQSRTEGRLEWNESKQLAMDGVLVNDVYLANQSSGALTDLNTIRASNNQLFTIEVSGGSIPDILKAEVVNLTDASLNNTALTLGGVVIDKKLSEDTFPFSGSASEPTLHNNSFYIRVPKPGDYALMLSLAYQEHAVNNSAMSNSSQGGDLTAIYKVILSVRG